jgi:hypothetical protein
MVLSTDSKHLAYKPTEMEVAGMSAFSLNQWKRIGASHVWGAKTKTSSVETEFWARVVQGTVSENV